MNRALKRFFVMGSLILVAVLLLAGVATAEEKGVSNTNESDFFASIIASSNDGNTILVESNFAHWGDGDSNNDAHQIYLLDMPTQVLTLISAKDGVESNKGAERAIMSGNGEHVYFASQSTNLSTTPPSDPIHAVYYYDRSKNSLSLSEQFPNLAYNITYYVSDDNRFFIFENVSGIQKLDTLTNQVTTIWNRYASGTPLVVLVTPDGKFVFVQTFDKTFTKCDTTTGERVTVTKLQNSFFVINSVTSDGRYVTVLSQVPLASDDTNGYPDVYLYDFGTDIITLESKSTSGKVGDERTEVGGISLDGRYMVLSSYATNLDDTHKTNGSNVFLRDLTNRTTLLISKSYAGGDTNGGNSGSRIFGKYIFFDSWATNLVTSMPPNISSKTGTAFDYAYDLETKKVSLIHPPPPASVVIFIPGMAGSELINQVSATDKHYVWPIFRDDPKKEMTLKPGDQNDGIYADNAIKEYNALNIEANIQTHWGNTHNPIYGPFLDVLQAQGYTEYKSAGHPEKRRLAGCDYDQKKANLFVFPWDWRFGVTDAIAPELSLHPSNVELLHEFIQCIELLHPNANITFISHSMGWFVGRSYVLSYPNEHLVKEHIAVAPPRIGAAKTIAMLLTGDFNPIISKNLTKSLLEHFVGAHELLPSKEYWELVDAPLSVAEHPFSQGLFATQRDIPLNELQHTLQELYRSPAEGDQYRSKVPFVQHMQTVYQNPAFINLQSDQTDVIYKILYGVQKDDFTIGKVTEKVLWNYLENKVETEHHEYDPSMTSGDQTVPEASATLQRKDQKKNLDLNENTPLYEFTGNEMVHDVILSQKSIQSCILEILNLVGQCPNVHAAATHHTNARYLKLWGVKTLQVSDGISTTENLMTSTLTLVRFPDVSTEYLGDNSIMLMISGEKAYTVTFTAQGKYFESENQYGTGDHLVQLVRFSPQPKENQVIELQTTQGEIATMAADENDDGKPDTQVQPVADLTESQANDSTGPILQATYSVTDGLVVTATDDLSGIAQVRYSTDSVHFEDYNKGLKFSNPAVLEVMVIAEDKVGNFSRLVSVTVTHESVVVPVMISVYLPWVVK